MKRVVKILTASVLLALAACSKNDNVGYGMLHIGLNTDGFVVETTKATVSDYAEVPGKEDFIIEITDSYSTLIWDGRLTEYDPYMLFQAGTYKVTASYGDISEEGFAKPYFYGSQDIVIVGDETTEAVVTASLGNTIVKIECTERFKKYFSEYSFSLSRSGTKIMDIPDDDPRGVFLDGYSFTIDGVFVSEMRTYDFSKDFNRLNPATVYSIVFDIDNVGSTSINVIFNDTVEVIDLGDIELND